MFDNVKFKGKGHEVRHNELLSYFLEDQFKLIDCCLSDVGRIDINLWLASYVQGGFLTVFGCTLLGFVVISLNKTIQDYLTK